MIGTNIPATTVITVRVFLLDTASHMVKLTVGLMLDGIRNGNRAKPAVNIEPVTAKVEPVKLSPALFFAAAKIMSNAPKIAEIGASMVTG